MPVILLIEDSLYQRSKLQYMLQAEGYQVLQAKDGLEGLYMAATSEPDLILLDLLMPRMDGMEFLRELREKHATFPVVILTADVQDSTRQKCLELGAKHVLHKPVKDDQLAETLRLVLGAKAASDDPSESAGTVDSGEPAPPGMSKAEQ